MDRRPDEEAATDEISFAASNFPGDQASDQPSFASQELVTRIETAGADGDVDRIKVVLQAALQHLIAVEAALIMPCGPVRALAEPHQPGQWCPFQGARHRGLDRALLAVIQEAHVPGVSTRKVDDLVAALGGCSISQSEVSRICAQLGEELGAFRDRSLAEEGDCPCVWVDATSRWPREQIVIW